MQLAVEEKCEFIPFQSPKNVQIKDNHITGMTFCRNEQQDDGSWIEDDDQVLKMKCNFVISAFGSGLYDEDGKRFKEICCGRKSVLAEKFIG